MTTKPDHPELAGCLGGQALIVFGGNLFTLAAGLPFQIYVARTLGAEQLGLFGLIEAAIVTLNGFLALGIAPTVVRFVPEHLAKKEFAHIRTLVLFATLSLLAIGGCAAAAIIAFSGVVAAWFEIDPAAQRVVAVMALTAPLGLLTFLYQQVLRGFHEILIMILSTSFVALTSKIAFAIIFFDMGWGTMGYACAVALSSAVALALMAVAAARLVSGLGEGTGAPAPIGPWFRYARIMYFNGLLSSSIAHLDRFIIGAAIGAHGVATLMVVRQLQQLPTVFHQMFLAVVAPMFAAAGGPGGGPRRQALYHMTTDWVMRLALPLILFLAVFGGPLLSLYGAEFSANGALLLLLCSVGVLANLALGPIGNLMNMSGLEAPLLRLIIMSICLTLGAYALFIPLVGLPGVGLGMIVSTLFLNISALRLARRRLGLSWWSARFVAWIVPGFFSLAALLALRAALGWRDDLSPTWLLAGLAAAYGCMAAGNALFGFHADDRAAFEAIRAKFSLAYSRLGASS